jgi:hypothetical protein
MALRERRLGPGECCDVETGARFFAALAFPAPREDNARREAELAWAGQYLQAVNRIDETTAPFADPRLNELVQADPERSKAVLRTSRRRLKDRLRTARAARPWVREWLGRPQALPAGLRKFTQRQIALFLSGENLEASDNFQKRVLRPSRPVQHLAIASELHDLELGETQLERGIDLAQVDWFARVVELSNQVKVPICNDKRFGVGEQDLLHLVWIQ